MTILAVAMNFAVRFLPDWNSLESVRRAHSHLEAASLVFFALLVVFEALAHLAEDEATERTLDKIGIVFFAVAVLAEIAAYPYGQRNDELAQQAIGSLDTKVKEAEGNASKAVSDSRTALGQATDALTKAGMAANALGKAESEAKGAQTASSNALTLATGAHKEADSFENDIKSAKQQATAAEQHLADALREAAQAQAELDRIKSPRSIVNRDKLTTDLRPFSGTVYVLNVFLDQESTEFIKAVAGALDAAGWVREQSKGFAIGNPTMRIDFGQGLEYVPSCIESGIGIHVRTKESLPVLRSTPFPSLPKIVQAALTLKASIAASISPSDEQNVGAGVIDPEPGEGLPITICVGKKP
ncbi:MAG: hypothetical protein ABSA96_16175 [Candidatus Acidiferrales bacterium]